MALLGLEAHDQPRAYAAKLALIAGAYYGAAKLGLHLAFATSSVTAIWPPTGIALAAVIIWGYRVWPGVVLGALLANSWTGVPIITTVGITCGNTLEALVGAYLLMQVADFRPSLERIRDVLALVIFAATVSTMVSATIGVLSLVVGDEVSIHDFGSVWRVWWLGDMGGDLLIAPFLLVTATHAPFNRAPGRVLEAVALATTLAGAGVLIFSESTNLAYLVFPLLIWAALRFWQPGAAAASLGIAGIAVWFTQDGSGPFVRSNPDDSLLLAQTFCGVAGITSLMLAAVVTERRRSEETVEHIARTLQESLLPSRLPKIPSVETAAHFRPAGLQYQVGGDFYDVFDSADGSWAIVIGDVCGKGPDAAAVTGLARYTLRAAAIHERSPSQILAVLNDAILRQRFDEKFCTVAYARMDLNGAGARLTVSTGGHPLPLLLRADGSVESVGAPGMLLGVEVDPRLSDHAVDLYAGDTLLLYTDGLTDAYAPGLILGAPDVAAILGSCAGLGASAVADRLQEAATYSRTAEPRDDIALLVLRMAADVAAGHEISIQLVSEARAPAAAREAIQGLHGQVEESLLGDLQLLTTELVTNSVRHAAAAPGSPIELKVSVSPSVVRVEVSDRGRGFEPSMPEPDLDRAFGWGLHLVARIADRWGVAGDGSSRVWFEIDR